VFARRGEAGSFLFGESLGMGFLCIGGEAVSRVQIG
jgi:hypothetical protein